MFQGVVESRLVNLHGKEAISRCLRPGRVSRELFAAGEAIAGNQAVLGRFQVDGGRVEPQFLQLGDELVFEFGLGLFDPFGDLLGRAFPRPG